MLYVRSSYWVAGYAVGDRTAQIIHVDIKVGSCTLTFHFPTSERPAGVALPWLLDAGRLRETAAIDSGELPSFSCAINNARGQASALLAVPLRSPLELWAGDDLLFAGVISRVSNGLQLAITAES